MEVVDSKQYIKGYIEGYALILNGPDHRTHPPEYKKRAHRQYWVNGLQDGIKDFSMGCAPRYQ